MKLGVYLSEKKQSPSAFARSLCKPPSTILRILAGDRNPSIKLIGEIIAVTGGAVTAADFLPPPPAPALPADQSPSSRAPSRSAREEGAGLSLATCLASQAGEPGTPKEGNDHAS